MPTSKNHTKSNRHRNYSRGLKTNVNSRISEYLGAAYKGTDPEKELALARKVGEFKGAEARIQSARAIADVAIRHASSFGSETMMLFSEAIESSIRVKNLDHIGVYSLMADRLRRQLSLNIAIAEGQIPSYEQIEKSHTEGINNINSVFSVWGNIKQGNPEAAKIAKGFMSEEATHLLLERYAIEQVGEGWVPMHSKFSEDSGRLTNGENKSGWDISIYTDCNEDIGIPTHKLQVKTRPSVTDEKYLPSENIDFIYVSELSVSWDRVKKDVMPQYILSELLDASEGDRKQQHRLDQRTEVLLDMFS